MPCGLGAQVAQEVGDEIESEDVIDHVEDALNRHVGKPLRNGIRGASAIWRVV